LHFCGIESDKHDGQLKRIAAPAITLLHALVTCADDEIYLDRFIRLTKEELFKINFPKHILRPADGRKLTTALTRAKTNTDDAVYELLSILLHEHLNVEGELEAVDMPFLLQGSKLCQDRFEEWLQKENLEHVRFHSLFLFFALFCAWLLCQETFTDHFVINCADQRNIRAPESRWTRNKIETRTRVSVLLGSRSFQVHSTTRRRRNRHCRGNIKLFAGFLY
jgi:hypothetical protein